MELLPMRTKIILTEEEAKAILLTRDLFEEMYNQLDDNDVENYARDAQKEIEYFLENCDIQVEKKQVTKTVLVAIVDLD